MTLVKIHHFFLYRKINFLYLKEYKSNIDTKDGLISSLQEISNLSNDLHLKRCVKIFISEVYFFRILLVLFLIIVFFNIFI